ncbi:MAG TPA: caspase family protein [Myxococcota bacterium]|nr:caspase family protein [Myxococcota bacterium]
MKTVALILLAAFAGLCACATGGRSKGGLEPLVDLETKTVSGALGSRRLALLVGIDEFSDERWPALKHARKDARDLGALLEDPHRGRFDHVEILADAGGESLSRVEAAIDRLSDSNTSRSDTVLLYFSTHGTLAREPGGDLRRYLVATDSDQGRVRRTTLAVDELLERFERMPSTRKVLILAACTSGSGKSALPDRLARELAGTKGGAFFVRPLEEISRATMVLTASSWGEAAREDDKLGHDIYTNFLIEALSGKDEDGDGAVTASEAHAYAMERTYYFSQGRQRPQMESTIIGADPIVLSGRRVRPADPVLFSFLPRFEGMRVTVDGRDKGKLPARLVLEPGAHRVVVSDDGNGSRPALDEKVELHSGDRVTIEQLMQDVEPRWHIVARAGYQMFLDAGVRRSMVAPAPVAGVSIARVDFPLDGFETGLDLVGGGGGQSLEIGGLAVSQDLVEIAYGLQLLYRFDLGPISLLVGPRLAGLHLLRRNLSAVGQDQHYFNFSPGLVAGLRLRMFAGISFDLDARIHFFTVHTDTENLDLGYLDLFGGLGWSF